MAMQPVSENDTFLEAYRWERRNHVLDDYPLMTSATPISMQKTIGQTTYKTKSFQQ